MVAPLWLIRLTDALSKIFGGPPGWREEWDACGQPIPYELGRIRKAETGNRFINAMIVGWLCGLIVMGVGIDLLGAYLLGSAYGVWR